MIKEIVFRLKIKKLDEIHIKQYLERKGYEIININSEIGQNLISKLKIDNPPHSSFVYNKNRLKYVFLAQTQNDNDKLMVLLHECGHIEHNHQTTTKYNEAQAWNFAYKAYNIYKQIFKFIITVFLSAVVTLSVASNIENSVSTAPVSTQIDVIPDHVPEPNITDDITASEEVYVTQSGTKYHLSGCRYIKGKNVIGLSRSEAATHYTPCKVCEP